MYVKIENGQISAYPYTVGQLRKDNPNTSFPKNISEAALASYGVFPVVRSSKEYDPLTQNRIYDSQPSLIDGVWVLDSTVVAASQDEITRRAAEAKERLIKPYEQAVQRMLDAEAQTKGYDGILSACTYANSTVVKFAGEGQAAINWRDTVWDSCYTILADVEAGNRAMPTVEELISELPTITWP